MSTGEQAVQLRLQELESRIAFQDDLIESLNEIVARQDRDIARLEARVKSLGDKIVELGEAGAVPGFSPGHEMPPHY